MDQAVFVRLAVLLGLLFLINTIVLIAALYIFGTLLRDIEFGTFVTLVAKGAALALTVSLIQFIPLIGGLLALLIWLGGFLVLFKMELTDCWLLVIVVGGLSYVARVAVVLALVKILP